MASRLLSHWSYVWKQQRDIESDFGNMEFATNVLYDIVLEYSLRNWGFRHNWTKPLERLFHKLKPLNCIYLVSDVFGLYLIVPGLRPYHYRKLHIELSTYTLFSSIFV